MPTVVPLTKTSILKLRLRRGPDSKRNELIFSEGEPAFAYDTARLFIGDGHTNGGVSVTWKGHVLNGTVDAAIVNNAVAEGDIFTFGSPYAFGNTISGPYLKGSGSAQYMGPNFNTNFFDVASGGSVILAQSLAPDMNPIHLKENQIKLNALFWTFNTGLLEIHGDVTVNGSVTATGTIVPSDYRLKNDISSFSFNAVDTLGRLTPYEYSYKSDKTSRKHIGFIAQEVEPVLPNIVHTDKLGYKSLNYQELIPILVEAVNNAHVKIRELELKIAKYDTVE